MSARKRVGVGGASTQTPKTAPSLTRSALRSFHQLTSAKSAQPSRTRPAAANTTPTRATRHTTPATSSSTGTGSRQRKNEEVRQDGQREEEDAEDESGAHDEDEQSTASAPRAEAANGDVDDEAAEDEEEEEEEEDEAGSGPDEDRQALPSRRAARRTTRRQSAPATLSHSSPASASTTTPTKRTQRTTRQPPATTARKTEATRSNKNRGQDEQDVRQQQRSQPLMDSTSSMVKPEQEDDDAETSSMGQSVGDGRKSPRLRSQLTPTSTKTANHSTPRKRSQSPLPPPSTPATSSSAGKKQRLSRVPVAIAPVVCSALPDVTLFCDDVVNATFDTLEDELKRERDNYNSIEDKDEAAAAANWLHAVEQTVTTSLTANVDKCEQYLQTNVWSVPSDVEERATDEVMQRPRQSQEEVTAVEVDLAQLRQRIVNVSVEYWDTLSTAIAAVIVECSVLLTHACCAVLFDCQQRHIRQQLKDEGQCTDPLSTSLTPVLEHCAPPPHSHAWCDLELTVMCCACVSGCVGFLLGCVRACSVSV